MILVSSHCIPSVDCISVIQPRHNCGVLHNCTPTHSWLHTAHSYRVHHSSCLELQTTQSVEDTEWGKSYLHVSVRQLEGRIPPERPGHVWDDNIKMTLQGTVRDGID